MPNPYRDPKDLIPLRELVLQPTPTTPEDTRALLRSRVAWDIVPDDKVQEWSPDLLMQRSSDEVAAKERAAAEIRRDRLVAIMPVLSDLALTAGDIVYRARLLTTGSQPNVEPEGTTLVRDDEGIVQAVRAGAFAVVAELLDMGVLGVIVGKVQR